MSALHQRTDYKELFLLVSMNNMILLNMVRFYIILFVQMSLPSTEDTLKLHWVSQLEEMIIEQLME
jgi:hypothetical protein